MVAAIGVGSRARVSGPGGRRALGLGTEPRLRGLAIPNAFQSGRSQGQLACKITPPLPLRQALRCLFGTTLLLTCGNANYGGLRSLLHVVNGRSDLTYLAKLPQAA